MPAQSDMKGQESVSFILEILSFFSRGIFIILSLSCVSGAGPHPKALSGRVICSTWWIFSIVLLACYFSNLSSSKTPESTHLMVKGFEDLANQDVIEYGCLAGSSTLAFFKVNKDLDVVR